MRTSLRQIYESLQRQVEAGQWWPAESDFEIVVGAILTQNTNWLNVEKALQNLGDKDLKDPKKILSAERSELTQAIRPAGYYNAKTEYLLAASRWFTERHQAVTSLPTDQLPTDQLRVELLGVHGIGAETADDILLYVYHRPVFIYDLYARRLLEAAGLGQYRSYQQAKRAIDPLVARSAFTTSELAEFHGLIVEAGKLARTGSWEAYLR